ncbi:MAG: hypothetical protein IJ563_04280 [Selenomonadaceae bacterium]|nr:hypothetical protein [Selenomonadaceae bacterium]
MSETNRSNLSQAAAKLKKAKRKNLNQDYESSEAPSKKINNNDDNDDSSLIDSIIDVVRHIKRN